MERVFVSPFYTLFFCFGRLYDLFFLCCSLYYYVWLLLWACRQPKISSSFYMIFRFSHNRSIPLYFFFFFILLLLLLLLLWFRSMFSRWYRGHVSLLSICHFSHKDFQLSDNYFTILCVHIRHTTNNGNNNDNNNEKLHARKVCYISFRPFAFLALTHFIENVAKRMIPIFKKLDVFGSPCKY